MGNLTDYGFNGSVVTFATVTLGVLRGIDYSEAGAKVDCTGSADAEKLYRTGIPDPTVTVTVVGPLVADTAVGKQGALVITWQDTGTDGSMTAGILVSRGKGGTMDGEMTSTYEFAPAQADT